MCGIVGIVHRDPERPVAPEIIRRMCTAIHHRGPDDEGLFVDGRVGLGMRRLSIIDLTGGRQPIYDAGHGISVRSVIPRVGLTREDDGFRDTYPLEGVGRGCRC